EPGELLDLQEVGVVAARPGLDGAAVPSGARGGLGVGAADEAARDLLDGDADGRPGRREQGPQFGLVDLRGAAAAPSGEDAFGAQQGAHEAADLVDGLAGHLADEIRGLDRKSRGLNSSYVKRSYAGFCLKNNDHKVS